MWIYVDTQSRVLAFNPNTMDGNTGWHETQCTLFDPTEAEGRTAVDVPLFNHRDIALYKYEATEDTIVQRTQEEMDADYVPPVPAETIEKRVETVEGKTAELEESLEMLLTGVTEDE